MSPLQNKKEKTFCHFQDTLQLVFSVFCNLLEQLLKSPGTPLKRIDNNIISFQTKEQDLLIPTYTSQGADENYEGATVIEPARGYVMS